MGQHRNIGYFVFAEMVLDTSIPGPTTGLHVYQDGFFKIATRFWVERVKLCKLGGVDHHGTRAITHRPHFTLISTAGCDLDHGRGAASPNYDSNL